MQGLDRDRSPQPDCTLSVSIINYRTAQMTIECVRSVLADFDGSAIAGHVVVVENGSGDGSAKVLSDWISLEGLAARVTLVVSPVNTGFSGGHNQGIAAHRAAFYLVLNSDALLRPGFCAAILAATAEDPQAGLWAPRIDYDTGEQQISCFRVASPQSELIRGAQTGAVTKLLARHVVALDMPPAPEQIGWASFACILLRDAMVQAIGPMDEGYFLYFEDTEYCLRARRAGWRIRHVPEARAVHFRGGSGPVKALARAKKRMPGYFYASRTRLLYQAHGLSGLWAANLCWILGRGIAQLRRLAGRSVPASNAGEWRDIWINATRPLGDRRAPEGTGLSRFHESLSTGDVPVQQVAAQ